MAVVYFTSNASTGAGSLVEAIKNASPGDVIRPDETVFERGSTIEIVLASTLTLDKSLTLDGGPYRVRLDGDGLARCCSVASGVNVEMTSFDIVGGGWNSQTNANVGNANGAGVSIAGDSSIALNRCGFFGCRGTYGGGLAIATNATAELSDCVIVGCYARGSGGGLRNLGNATIYGSSIIGNVAVAPETTGDILVDGSGRVTLTNSIVGKYRGNVEIGAGCVDGVAPSQIGFVASPPDDLSAGTWDVDAWRNWDLRLFDDASPNPSPYRDSGDVDTATKYDFDGNFRGRETNGVATCSPGAFETIQADLFWIGRNYNGTEVVYPSWQNASGWAASRFATGSGATEPTANSAVFIGSTATFMGAPPTAAAIMIGANGVNFSGSVDVKLTLGATTTATIGGVLAGLRLGDWAALTPSSLTIPAVEFIGENVAVAGVPVGALDGVIFAAAAQPSSLTTTGSGGWADVSAGVTALTVTVINETTVAANIIKTSPSKSAFVQFSDDDGATWQTVATTASVDKYELTVARGSDVTVRAATSAGWLTETVSAAIFLPVWTVQGAFETVVSVANAFEVVTGGSNDGLNDYDFEDYGYL